MGRSILSLCCAAAIASNTSEYVTKLQNQLMTTFTLNCLIAKPFFSTYSLFKAYVIKSAQLNKLMNKYFFKYGAMIAFIRMTWVHLTVKVVALAVLKSYSKLLIYLKLQKLITNVSF